MLLQQLKQKKLRLHKRLCLLAGKSHPTLLRG